MGAGVFLPDRPLVLVVKKEAQGRGALPQKTLFGSVLSDVFYCCSHLVTVREWSRSWTVLCETSDAEVRQ